MSRSSVQLRQVALFCLDMENASAMKKTVILASLFFISQIFAAGSVGTSGFQFLKTQVAARPAAMAGAFSAVSADVSALFYNPAGIADFQSQAASFTYTNDIVDFNSGFIGYVKPQVGPGTAGLSVVYKNYGTLQGRDVTGQSTGDFSANSLALAGSYAKTLFLNFSAGATAKFIYSGIENYNATAVAFDWGVMYKIPSQMLVLAAGMSNMGSMLSAFVDEMHPLPMQMRAGFSKRLAHLPLLIGFNAYKYNDEDWNWALGGEFTLSPQLFLRLGYDSFGKYLAVDSEQDTFAGASAGLGFLWEWLQVDYAFTTLGELGSINRFTLSADF